MLLKTRFLILFFALLITFSCKKESPFQLSNYVHQFIANTDALISYGAVDYLSMKEKADLSNISFFGDIVLNQLKPIEKGLKLEDKLYFCVRESSGEYGYTPMVYLFASVKNKGELINAAEKFGLVLQQKDNYTAIYEEQFVLAFDDDKIVGFFAQKMNEASPEMHQFFSKEFENIPLAEDVPSYDADFSFAVKYGNSSTESFTEFLKGEVNFDVGAIHASFDFREINASNNFLLYLKEGQRKSALEYLDFSTSQGFLAAQLNMEKMDSLFNDSEQRNDLFRWLGLTNVQNNLIISLVKGKMEDFTNGDMGVVVQHFSKDESILPSEFQFFMGWGKDKQKALDILESFSYFEGFTKIDAFVPTYSTEKFIFKATDFALLVQTKQEQGETPIFENTIPPFQFQNSPFQMSLRTESFLPSLPYLPLSAIVYPILHSTTTFNVIGDTEKINMEIQFKNKSENSVKQIVKGILEQNN